MGTAAPFMRRELPEWPNGSAMWGRGPGTGVIMVLASLFFVLFFASISRFGTEFIPSTTNLFWAMAYGMLAVSLWWKPEAFAASFSHNQMLLLAAGFATLSGLWSLTPALSAYRGVMLLLNILVGFMVFQHLGLKRTVILLFSFIMLAQLGSLAMLVIHHPLAYDHLGLAKGLYLHKNNLAIYAVLLYFTSLILFAARWRPVISLGGAGLAIAMLLLSKSGTGLIVLTMMTTILIGCVIVASGVRATQFFAGLGVCLAGLVVGALVIKEIDPFTMLLDALGKDGTLTGRTTLWEYALTTFYESPLVGIGYFSYWNSPETSAASLWIVTGQTLTSFHNNFLDIAVAVGIIGLIPFVAAMAVLLVRTFRQFVETRDPLLAWPFAYMCFVTIYSVSEYPLFWNSEFQMLMAFVAGGAASYPGLQADSRLGMERQRDPMNQGFDGSGGRALGQPSG